jgi:hypothetical protein
MIKLATERKHLTDIIKMLAYQCGPQKLDLAKEVASFCSYGMMSAC